MIAAGPQHHSFLRNSAVETPHPSRDSQTAFVDFWCSNRVENPSRWNRNIACYGIQLCDCQRRSTNSLLDSKLCLVSIGGVVLFAIYWTTGFSCGWMCTPISLRVDEGLIPGVSWVEGADVIEVHADNPLA